MGNFIAMESELLLLIQENIRVPFWDTLVIPFTLTNNGGILCIAFTLLFLCIRSLRKTGIQMSISLLLEFVTVNLVLKNLVARTRPYEVIDGLTILVEKVPDFSFPSGHTGSSFAIAVVIFMTMPRRYGVTAIILATLMGLSRLYVGVHYPSDVVAGALVGIITAMAAVKVIYPRLAAGLARKKAE